MSSKGVAAVGKWATKKVFIWIIGLFGLTGIVSFLLCIIAVLMIIGAQVSSTDTAENTLNVSANVAQYRAVVTKYCTKYKIPDQVDVILAIIMQESGGNSPDVMQSSESMGLAPNAITDPEESIKAGVKAYAGTYNAAKKAKKNRVETALQGYNYGNGYVTWAINKNGGYTKANAIEFAQMHSHGVQRPNGTYAYGDSNYVPHVERYLTVVNGQVVAALPAGSKATEKAISEGEKLIGKTTYVFGGGRNAADIKAGRFDCSSFVHYAFAQAGIKVGWTTDQLVSEGEKISAKKAKRGDLVFFDTYKKNGHVGILLGDGSFLACNTSNGVSISSLSNSYWKSKYNGTIIRVTK